MHRLLSATWNGLKVKQKNGPFLNWSQQNDDDESG